MGSPIAFSYLVETYRDKKRSAYQDTPQRSSGLVKQERLFVVRFILLVNDLEGRQLLFEG